MQPNDVESKVYVDLYSAYTLTNLY